MNESESKNEKPKEGRRFSQEQYEMLKRCSDKKDMTEWNEWRKKHFDEEILLEGADLCDLYLKDADLGNACLAGARLERSNLVSSILKDAKLREAVLSVANLAGANLTRAQLEGATFGHARLEGAVLCEANLVGAKLRNTHLESAKLSNANLKLATLTQAHMENANLCDANLEAADVRKANLKGARLSRANLKGTNFDYANLKGADLNRTYLEDTTLCFTHLEGANLDGSHLEDARFGWAIVDGATLLRKCKVNQYTDFHGVSLDSVRIEPGTKQLLEYNIRRMNWERWYKYEDWDNVCPKKERSKVSQVLRLPVCCFWQISDYGRSTKQIIYTFFQLAIIFAGIYYAWGLIDYDFLGIKGHPGIVSDLFVIEHKQESVSRWLVPFRAVYFSIVTMTTLGFGDMYANAHSFVRGLFGHALLALQVILGYVLLGALVTRFAVLFTAGGPAGKFADEKEKETKESKSE